jgi:hypothetical protein
MLPACVALGGMTHVEPSKFSVNGIEKTHCAFTLTDKKRTSKKV